MNRSKVLRAVSTAALSIACVAGLAACSSTDSASGGIAATVNGVEIQEQTITDYIQDFRETQGLTDDDSWAAWMATYGSDPASIRDQVVDMYVDEELTKQAAEENGISVTDEEVQEQVDLMKANYSDDAAWESALSSAGVTEDQYRDSIRNAMLEQRLEEQVITDGVDGPSDDEILEYVKLYAPAFSGAKRSSHILFGSDDSETAQQVLDQINDGTLDFAEAAEQYSTDTGSAENGGDVGWDLLNSFVTEYTDALDELDEGQVSDLVTSQFGIHVIKCTELYEAPEEITSLDQVPSELVDYITQMVSSDYENNAYTEWMAEYKENADVVINDMPEGLPYDVDMSAYATDEDEDADAEADAEDDLDVDIEADADADADAEAEADADAQSDADAEDAADSTEAASDADASADGDAAEEAQ